jgi:hypothetical protein
MRTVKSAGALTLCFILTACGSDSAGNANGPSTTTATSGTQGTGGTGGAATSGSGGTSTGAGGTSSSSSGGTAVGTGGSGAPDAGGGGAKPSDGGSSCGAPSVAGTAGHSAEGILTNFPGFHFTKTGGDFTITSIYFKLQQLSTFNSIQVWGDLKNTGTTQLCIPLADTFNIGSQDVIVVVDGDAFKGSSSVSDTCLEPGGKAFFKGIQNDVSASLLAANPTITYAISGFRSTMLEIRHPSDPVLLSAAPTQTSLGWALAGKMRAPATIWNLEVGVYVRDPNGLLYNDIDAFPSDLGTIPGLTEFDFATNSSPNQFCDYERFESFIDGPKTSAFGEKTSSALQGRALEYTSRVEAFHTAKNLLASAK